MNRTIITALVVAAALPLAAADFAARKQLQQRSVNEGVGVARLPLLGVKAGPGRALALSAVRARLGNGIEQITFSGTPQEAHGARSIVQATGTWRLEVAADGRKARYRNFGYVDSPANRGVPVGQRPSQDALERKARSFATSTLRDLVRLGPGEELVPLYTEYQVNGGGSTAPGSPRDPEVVVGANVVYGRSIDGVHIIGAGSKLAVMFGADGTLVGFDYDWPEYTRLPRVQRVVSAETVRRRSRELGAEDDQTRADRIECGYFDPGSGRRDPAAPLQAACAVFTVRRPIVDPAVHARDRASGHLLIARVSFIPAGETVESDARWPEAQRLSGSAAATTSAPDAAPRAPR